MPATTLGRPNSASILSVRVANRMKSLHTVHSDRERGLVRIISVSFYAVFFVFFFLISVSYRPAQLKLPERGGGAVECALKPVFASLSGAPSSLWCMTAADRKSVV